MKKRILMLRSTFFPTESPGNVRIKNFAKYLANGGHDVTVAMLAQGNVAETKCDIDRARLEGYAFAPVRIPRWANGFIRIFDYGVWRFLRYPHNWCLKSVILKHHVFKRFKKGDFDVVFVSVPQPGSLSVGESVSRRFNIPFVIDFRDLPDELDVTHRLAVTRREFAYTIRYCRAAAFAVTVSPQLQKALIERYGIHEVGVVYNGYEGKYKVRRSFVLNNESFNILYTGILGVGRNPRLVLGGIDELIRKGFDLTGVRIVFVGVAKDAIASYRCNLCYSMIEALGRKSRTECLDMQRKAGVLVSLASSGVPGILTSKIFDYANAGRPILSVPCEHGALDEFILKAHIGIACDSVEEVARWLKDQITAWRDGVTAPGYDPNVSYLESFSRSSQTAVLAAMLKEKVFKDE